MSRENTRTDGVDQALSLTNLVQDKQPESSREVGVTSSKKLCFFSGGRQTVF